MQQMTIACCIRPRFVLDKYVSLTDQPVVPTLLGLPPLQNSYSKLPYLDMRNPIHTNRIPSLVYISLVMPLSGTYLYHVQLGDMGDANEDGVKRSLELHLDPHLSVSHH